MQPLDQDIIVALKLQYKSKLLEWALSEFDSDQQHDLIKVISNIKQVILGSCKVWTVLDPQIIWNYWRKSRLTKDSKDLALLISKLQLGQDEMPFEDNLIMRDEDIIEVEYYMLELVNTALG